MGKEFSNKIELLAILMDNGISCSDSGEYIRVYSPIKLELLEKLMKIGFKHLRSSLDINNVPFICIYY